MLGMHHDKQNKVLDEINAVIGTYDGLLDIEVLNKLTYLEMVIKETLRLLPVVPVVSREATADVVLDEKYTIPEGGLLIISPYDLQRNPKYWGDEAHLFIPERFEAEKMKNIHPYAFIPFISGMRICVGWRYSMYFMKTYLVRFLKSYKVDTSLKLEELKAELTPSLIITQGFMLSIDKRE
jgi:cytochrome P450 family 313